MQNASDKYTAFKELLGVCKEMIAILCSERSDHKMWWLPKAAESVPK